MFTLSKLFWIIFQPLNFLVILLSLAVILKSWRATRFILVAILAFGILPIGSFAIHHLERIYKFPTELPKDIAGVIILGGGMDLHTKINTPNAPQLTAASERIIEGIALSKQYPNAPIIFSGGAGAIEHPDYNEAEQVKILLKKLEIPEGKFYFENSSKNTHQNAANLFDLGFVTKAAGKKYILVTSAYHLPRAVKIFEHFGFKIIPYPAGYVEDDEFSWTPNFSILKNYTKLDIVLKEYIGILAEWLKLQHVNKNT